MRIIVLLGICPLLHEQSFEKVLNMDKLQKATFEAQYKSEIKNTPIHQRVSTQIFKNY